MMTVTKILQPIKIQVMLTNHNYVKIDSNWDKDILDCCKKQDPGDPCTDCCYDTWQRELKIVTQTYSQAQETANQLQNKWNFIYSRRNTYKTWVDELDKAENLARDICYQLELIALQSDKIWFNSCKAIDAIEILFCMIRDYFTQIDLLKSKYDDLQNCITKNNDPSLVKGQGILKYLDDYKQKLDAIVKTKDDIIKSILEAIRLSNLITNYISTRDCNIAYDPCAKDQKPCIVINGDAYYGLKTIICEWYNDFECDVECTGGTVPATTDQSKQNTNEQLGKDECKDDISCELVPTFDFPICNNTYKTCIQQWLAKDDTDMAQLTKDLQEAKKKKEALIACKNSLDNAIKAVNPKDRCK